MLRPLKRPAFLAVAVLCLPSLVAQAASITPGSSSQVGPVQTRFDAARQETDVAGHITPALCFSFNLPQEWRMRADGARMSLVAAHHGAELEVSLRSAQELRHMPQPDLASRDAAFLQQGYEDLLGRPAQSVSLASLSGATRWSATWVDANLPSASHAMTVEAFIVPLSKEWVAEMSLTGIASKSAYDALVQDLLADFRVKAAC